MDEYGILIIRDNILKYYNLFIENFHKGIKKEDKNEYKKIAFISKEQEEVSIGMLKEEIDKGKLKNKNKKKE